jgi:hypothetical protein
MVKFASLLLVFVFCSTRAAGAAPLDSSFCVSPIAEVTPVSDSLDDVPVIPDAAAQMETLRLQLLDTAEPRTTRLDGDRPEPEMEQMAFAKLEAASLLRLSTGMFILGWVLRRR